MLMPQTNMLHGRRPLGTLCYIGKRMVDEPFCFSMLQMLSFCYEECPPDGYIHIDHAVGSGQIQGRNELCQKMQGDWICMVDSDEEVEPDTLLRMLRYFEGHKLDVLTGLYVFTDPPHNPVLYQSHEGEYKNMVTWGEPESNIVLLPIECAGAGALLIRRSVLQRIAERFGGLPFDPIPPYFTDDFAFFEKCRILGIKCYCAPGIEFGHIGTRTIWPHDRNPEDAPPTLTTMREALAEI